MATLKEKNEVPLAAITLFNAVLVYLFINGMMLDAKKLNEILNFWQAGTLALLVALFTNIINHLFSRNVKDWLVYPRKKPAPGHRAFSDYAIKDPRIDINKIKEQIGIDDIDNITSQEQNKIWYKMLKSCGDTPEIEQSHKKWLLFRDMNSLVILFCILLMIASLIFETPNHAIYIQVIFLLELILVWFAARNSGIALVQNVMAVKSSC